MAEVDLSIAGRSYRIACRDGEEDNLRLAGQLVDSKSREALAGLGTMSEARQLLYAALLIADELIEKGAASVRAAPDPAIAERAELLANRLESLADALENSAPVS
jgi:cell division protein ZapA